MAALRANRAPIDVGGHFGRYWDAGDPGAPVVVLLPSPLARGQAYLRTANALVRRRLRVITVEMPGSGGGSTLKIPWTFGDYAKWLAGFLDRLGLNHVTLVGHSNAGATALLVAAEYPRRVAALVLNDAVGARPLGSISGVILRHVPEFPFEYWFNWRAGPDVFYNMLVHRRNFWAQARSAATERVIHRAAAVRVPTLIAWGRHDLTVPLDCAELFHRALPHSRLYISPQGRHDWIIERPVEFAEVVWRLVLDQVSPARGGVRMILRHA